MTYAHMALVAYYSMAIGTATWTAVQGALATQAGLGGKGTLAGGPWQNTFRTIAAFGLWPVYIGLLTRDAVIYTRRARKIYGHANEPAMPPRVPVPPVRNGGQLPVVPPPASSPTPFRREPTVIGRTKDDRLLVDASTHEEPSKFYLMREPDPSAFEQAIARGLQRQVAKLEREAMRANRRYPL